MGRTGLCPNQWDKKRLEAVSVKLGPDRLNILLVPLLESHLGGFTAAKLVASQGRRSCGAGTCHIHRGVRVTIDPKDQGVRTDFWLTQIEVRIQVHKRRLDNRA